MGGVLVVVAGAIASNLSHALLWFSHSASTPLVVGPGLALRACVQLLVLGWGLYVVVSPTSRGPGEARRAGPGGRVVKTGRTTPWAKERQQSRRKPTGGRRD